MARTVAMDVDGVVDRAAGGMAVSDGAAVGRAAGRAVGGVAGGAEGWVVEEEERAAGGVPGGG